VRTEFGKGDHFGTKGTSIWLYSKNFTALTMQSVHMWFCK